MVLWEITVATAYFLGLKRTYRLALRIQRRLIGPNHPKLSDFAHSSQEPEHISVFLSEIFKSDDLSQLQRLLSECKISELNLEKLLGFESWLSQQLSSLVTTLEKYSKPKAARRTRAVFDVALSAHRKIQQRDLDVGRSVGNWILRWLDRMKPSAQIRGEAALLNSQGPRAAKPIRDSRQPTGTHGVNNRKITGQDSDGRMLASPGNIWLPKASSTLGMILPPQKAAGMSGSYYRHIYVLPAPHMGTVRYDGVFRRDIAQWMQG